MITRRTFLKSLGLGALASSALGAYAVAIEPIHRLELTHYRFVPRRWSGGLKLRIVVLADLHACRPWMDEARIEEIVDQANGLAPDLTLLLGDYVSGMRLVTGAITPAQWGPLIGKLTAKLGVYSVLGNHDWWEDVAAQRTGQGPTESQITLEKQGITVLENQALRLSHNGVDFWLAGLGDQLAFTPKSRMARWHGVDDLPGTLSQIDGDDPVLLMAHEPDIFPRVPDRVSVTLSGHTHGGQVRLFGYSPAVPSRFGNRYAYGHVVEDGRDLVVSGGLGCSLAPIRFGSPPEIVLLELG